MENELNEWKRVLAWKRLDHTNQEEEESEFHPFARISAQQSHLRHQIIVAKGRSSKQGASHSSTFGHCWRYRETVSKKERERKREREREREREYPNEKGPKRRVYWFSGWHRRLPRPTQFTLLTFSFFFSLSFPNSLVSLFLFLFRQSRCVCLVGFTHLLTFSSLSKEILRPVSVHTTQKVPSEKRCVHKPILEGFLFFFFVLRCVCVYTRFTFYFYSHVLLLSIFLTFSPICFFSLPSFLTFSSSFSSTVLCHLHLSQCKTAEVK